MNYKVVSCKRIINRVFGAFNNLISQDSERLLGESVDWIGDVLESIAATTPLVDKTEELLIKNGKAVIPCDLYLIKAVSYKGQYIRYGSQVFNYNLHCDNCINESVVKSDYTYTVNPGYINTNIPDDEKLCVHYQAFPTDAEGYPLIPDHVTVTQAMFYYITYMLMVGGFEHPNKQFTLQFVHNEYMKYRTQAENQLEMFDMPRMESFKNQWVRLIPNLNTASGFYYSDSIPETFTNTRHYR